VPNIFNLKNYKPCKLVLLGDGGEPVGVGGGVEVATALTVALDERSGTGFVHK